MARAPSQRIALVAVAAALLFLTGTASAQTGKCIATAATRSAVEGRPADLSCDLTGQLGISGALGGGQFPASLGSEANAASLSVTQSTEDKVVQSAIQTAVEATKAAVEFLSALNYTPPDDSDVSSVNDAAVSTTCLASNASRQGARFFNDSTSVAYLLEDEGTASATNFTARLDPGGLYILPMNTGGVYTDLVKCIWASDASGAMRVTEIVP